MSFGLQMSLVVDLQLSIKRWCILITFSQQSCEKVMFLQVYDCLFIGGVSHVIITIDALDLTVQCPSQ